MKQSPHKTLTDHERDNINYVLAQINTYARADDRELSEDRENAKDVMAWFLSGVACTDIDLVDVGRVLISAAMIMNDHTDGCPQVSACVSAFLLAGMEMITPLIYGEVPDVPDAL